MEIKRPKIKSMKYEDFKDNEYIDIDRMITAAKIYANALIRLAGE